MVSIPAGAFRIGSEQHYPEEAPVHRVTILPLPHREADHRASCDLDCRWRGVARGHDRDLSTIWHNLVERPAGPLSFRFILQPLMAAITATVDGLRDARTVRSPFFRAVLFEPRHRTSRLVEAMNAIARTILLGVVMDIIYQVIALKRFYPAEAVIVALLLAVVPYVVLRGLITRGARWWWRSAPVSRT
jgi:hypothetical protein